MQGSVVAGRIFKILSPADALPPFAGSFVVIEEFVISDTKHQRYNMPILTRTGQLIVSEPCVSTKHIKHIFVYSWCTAANYVQVQHST